MERDRHGERETRREADTERDRHGERQTRREADTERDRHGERQTWRECQEGLIHRVRKPCKSKRMKNDVDSL